MNNFSNMNYYVPNNFIYPDAVEAKKQLNDILTKQEEKVQSNQNIQENPKDNFNFNICNYNQKVDPKQVYKVYDGFIRGNMFPDLYNQYKINKPFEVNFLNEEGQLLTYVNAYSFAAHELNLYLDNNPDDKAMIQLFNQYTEEANKAKEEYAKKFGPLFVDQSNTYPWAWNKAPWPWENR